MLNEFMSKWQAIRGAPYVHMWNKGLGLLRQAFHWHYQSETSDFLWFYQPV